MHHTASLPLAGIHEPPFLLNFLCLSFLFSTVAGELHTAPTPGKPWLPVLAYLEAKQNPVLTGNCPGTLNRQQLPKAIFFSSSEETINFSHDSLNCNSKWHRFCYLFPWKTCLKWMMNECIADGCISLCYQSCTLKMSCEISVVLLHTVTMCVARQCPGRDWVAISGSEPWMLFVFGTSQRIMSPDRPEFKEDLFLFHCWGED